MLSPTAFSYCVLPRCESLSLGVEGVPRGVRVSVRLDDIQYSMQRRRELAYERPSF
jgi:hypothetical protein